MIATVVEGPEPRPDDAAAVNCSFLVPALVVAAVVGACANRWYLSRFRRAVANVRARGLAGAEHPRALSRLGGTDLVAPFAFPVAYAAVSVLVRVALVGAPGF